MDFSISEEQRAFVDTVRRVCQKEFKRRARSNISTAPGRRRT